VVKTAPKSNTDIASVQKPFLNYYASTFILYELSTPFLNIHWFLDKVNMTGSKAQWYNGMALLSVFFSCRLIWGTWQSIIVYSDMWTALQQTWNASSGPLTEPVNINANVFQLTRSSMCIDETCARANAEISQFKEYSAAGVPTWLVLTYVLSNIVLNFLNYFWFFKMVETVLKRFRTPEASGAKAGVPEKKGESAESDGPAQDIILEAAAGLETEGTTLPEHASGDVSLGANEELRKRRVDLASKIPLPGS
jgi:hypothetical protein